MRRKRNKNRKKLKKVEPGMDSLFESDEHFGFIAGYTPNGVPFGLTHKEWDEINSEIVKEKNCTLLTSDGDFDHLNPDIISVKKIL